MIIVTTSSEPRLRPLIDVLAHQLGGPGTEWESALARALPSPAASLPVAPATDREVWGPTGRADSATVHGVLARAEAERAAPWPQPLASQAARVHRDGNREEWESAAFERQRRLTRATVAAAHTLDDAWIDSVADGVQLLCEQSSWCWPAHDDTRERHGAVLATVSAPFLDLGAGEIAAQLAWIDHLLSDALDDRYPGLRARMRTEVRTRVIDPFLTRRDWHWIGLDGDVHNWNPWIHGNVVTAALRLLDGPDDTGVRGETIALALDGLDRYVAALPSDGAIDEGFGYWWNGACRALETLDLLAVVTDGVLDPSARIEALRETVAFPHRSHLGGPWYVNFADGQARPARDQPWHALHRAAHRVGDSAAAAHAAWHRIAGTAAASEVEGLGRLLRGMTDAAWLGATGAPPLPRDVVLPSTQTLLARQSTGRADGLTLVVKGGHNGENHNHNDVGSFIVASDGVPVIVDAGRPTYTKQTFGPDRYDIWTMQSDWHNVPEIRGASQPAGETWAAADVTVQVTDAATSQELELAGAYDVEGLRSWRRRALLDRLGRRVQVLDEWDLAPAGETSAPTSLHLLLAGEVSLHPGGARVVPLASAPPVLLRWPDDIEASAEIRPLDDPLLRDVWGPQLVRLTLPVAGRTRASLTIEVADDGSRGAMPEGEER
ncbi:MULTISPECIES: heparinase II/III domain-containing protein [unclassified Rathayibacter]|uniref:heparinase II/III domain-containing protein n=1 Tax=unclassified Rathayibacter TaxID=2609250 RepID=UPI0006FEBD2D|nr:MULTISPECIES: heparinase II/III family protein [unclassified Rathayibacter]KQQ05537.1 hypothetical protein ASF42_02900 [Rathayibacter sp. Leaf294]KQS13400.1 hypothetical protein ASG06_02915 [Rathayibacter sp. Leaf185]